MTPIPNRAEVERFLKALDPAPDARFTFQTFDDDKKRKKARAEANKLRKKEGKKPLLDPFAKIRHGTLADHYDMLAKLNAKSASTRPTAKAGRRRTSYACAQSSPISTARHSTR